MTPPVGPPPTKKRKVSKGEISACNEKDLRKLLCKHGDDRKKVLESRLQDVTVTFYCASEVASLNKKDSKFKNDWNDLKQGERGVLQTAHGFIKKSRGDMDKASCATYRDQLKHKPHNSRYPRSTLLKTQNLIDLLPLSQFHSVRKRTFSCKIDHIRNDASSYSPKGHDSEPMMGVLTDRDTYLALPISVEAVQEEEVLH